MPAGTPRKAKRKKARTPLKPSDQTDPDHEPSGETGQVEGRARKNDRRCIASGVSLGGNDPAIRFVLSPDGVVVPDLAEKLPGRGAWVTADRALVLKAAQKGLFSRAFKAQAKLPDGGPDAFVEALAGALADRALNALGLARRAGFLLIGYEKTRAAVQKGAASAYIHASDAASDGTDKIRQVANPALPVWHPFPGSDLDGALGEANIVHMALTDPGMARRFGREAARFVAYGGKEA
ncbi:RNA-binding protein [Aquisalinus luteolus]|nr:RNA-binding protein [Aquisalinus luteolus]